MSRSSGELPASFCALLSESSPKKKQLLKTRIKIDREERFARQSRGVRAAVSDCAGSPLHCSEWTRTVPLRVERGVLGLIIIIIMCRCCCSSSTALPPSHAHDFFSLPLFAEELYITGPEVQPGNRRWRTTSFGFLGAARVCRAAHAV